MADLNTVKVITPTIGTAGTQTVFSVVGTSKSYLMPRGPVTFQGNVYSTATNAIAGSATVQVSNDNAQWLPLGTLTASGTSTTTSDGFACVAPWAYSRVVVTTLTTGISANMKVFVGM